MFVYSSAGHLDIPRPFIIHTTVCHGQINSVDFKLSRQLINAAWVIEQVIRGDSHYVDVDIKRGTTRDVTARTIDIITSS